MSIRGEILNNLEAMLNGITTLNGYAMDIGSVQRRAFSQDEIDRGRSPAVAIVDNGIERSLGYVGTNQRMKAVITIDGLVRAGSNSPTAANVSEYFNTFIADVRKCVYASDLGSNVIYQRLGELRAFVAETAIAFEYDLEILYYYPEASP